MRISHLSFLVIAISISTSAFADRTKQVEVTNFPALQEVDVTNFPAVQDVNVTNNNNATRQQVEIVHGNVTSQVAARITIATNPIFPILNGEVPAGKKLVLTDFILNHAITTSTGIVGANIRRAAADTNCTDGPFGLRVQFRVPQGASVIASLTTGMEYYEGEHVCLATGSGGALSYFISGYLTDM